MPWTVDKVDEHKKGLTDAQKEVWVKVANSSLTRCESSGGKDCEASAIRQANSVVDKQMSYETWEKEYKLSQTFNIQGIEIFSSGIWNGDKYTEKDIDEIVFAFDQVGFEPPLKLGHSQKDGQPAYGWIGKVYKQGQKLLADFKDLPQKVYEAMKRGNYKRVSSEIFWNYAANGKSFPRVLKAVALLGADIPAVTDLDAIQNLYTQNADIRFYEDKKPTEDKMTIEELQKKIDELMKEKAAIEAKSKKTELAQAEADATLAAVEAAKAELEAKFVEIEKAKTEVETKLAEQQAEAKTSQVKAFISEQKKAGKVLPAFEKELETVLMSASDVHVFTYKKDDKDVKLSQKETIERIITGLPKIIEFAEIASDEEIDLDGYNTDPGVEVDRRARLLMDKGKAKNYDEAISVVLERDKKLKEAYAGGV